MVSPLIIRIGKFFPVPIRSFVARIVLSPRSGTNLVGEESGLVETGAMLQASRVPVVLGEVKPWARSNNRPPITVSIVTHENAIWIESFLASLTAQHYPTGSIDLRVVDHSTTGDVASEFDQRAADLRSRFRSYHFERAENRGFGAGHNRNLRAATTEFVLVTNIDLVFDPEAITDLVGAAVAAPGTVASWETRQFPLEHPKYVDPVSLHVSWSSHCCCLFRRAEVLDAGGYDEAIFLYGEDVELSFRLRSAGYACVYVPTAKVFHFTEDQSTRSTHHEHFGGVLANSLIRQRYATGAARSGAALRLARLYLRPPLADPSYRRHAAANVVAFHRLKRSFRSVEGLPGPFPIRGWDYEMRKDDGRHDGGVTSLPADLPLVSIVTRTTGQRLDLLAEAMASVNNQTYPRIEHIVVEDGSGHAEAVSNMMSSPHVTRRFYSIPPSGRSATGNKGVEAASGELVMFLDDDDLLFPDHVETLFRALRSNRRAVAAYSRALEVAVSDPVNGLRQEVRHWVPPIHLQSWDFEVLKHHNFMAIQSVLFKRSLFLERGGLAEDMHALEDWNLWVRYGFAHTFAEVPKVTSMYRVFGSPAQREMRRRVLSEAYATASMRNDDDVRHLAEITR